MAEPSTTEPSAGNTIQPKPTKTNNWQLTLNDVSKFDELLKYLTHLKSLNYIIACKEIAPTTGHEHIHIYCQFKTSITLSLKHTCGAHIEKCRGTPQQNQDYIRKDGNILFEWGTIRKSGNFSIKDVKEMNHEQRDELPIQYANIVRRMNEDEADSIELDDIHKDVKVYYIWGESGVGKTTKAFNIIRESGYTKLHMLKYENSFYSGVGSGHGAAIYDDFRDSHMKASEFINLIDYNIHTMNIKGGNKQNRFELIIITSIQNPKYIYGKLGDEPRKQWMRRMEILHMTDNTNDESDTDSIDIDGLF